MYRIIDGTRTHLDEAARLWAEATSTRDGDDDVAPLKISRPIIQRVLDNSPRAFLLVVLDAHAETVGFAAVAPVPDDAALAELHYVGVSPRIWGGGVGKYLMRAIPAELETRGFSSARLTVYAHNSRAVRLYEQMGWRRHGEPKPHPRSGKLEQEYRLAL
jgi:ribosomal protein S18 acetylase RimI-like enzyme